MNELKADIPTWISDAFNQHEPSLLRYAQKLTGDSEVARDVVQETFLRLFQADREKISSRLPEWLFVVCRNKALDLLRRETRRRKVRQRRPDAFELSQSRSPVEELEHRQMLTQVVKLLDSLPEKQADLLRLRFRDGLSYREIARKRNLSESNVGYLIHMGMRTLREQFRGGQDGT